MNVTFSSGEFISIARFVAKFVLPTNPFEYQTEKGKILWEKLSSIYNEIVIASLIGDDDEVLVSIKSNGGQTFF